MSFMVKQGLVKKWDWDKKGKIIAWWCDLPSTISKVETVFKGAIILREFTNTMLYHGLVNGILNEILTLRKLVWSILVYQYPLVLNKD